MATRNQLKKLREEARKIFPDDSIMPVRIIQYDEEGNILENLDNGEVKKYTPEEWEKEIKEVCLVRADKKYHKFKNDKPTVIVDDIK